MKYFKKTFLILSEAFFFILNLFLTIFIALNFSVAQTITFSEHIAPIIYKNCTPCHRKGEIGPFPLITYKDAVSKAKLLQYVTETRLMPPWKTDTSYSRFLDEKILGSEEIDLIKKWVESGAKQGDVSLLPPVPEFSISQIGKPDMVLEMPKPYKIKGNNRDTVLYFKVPFNLPKDTFVSAYEFRPGNTSVVHHSNPMIYDSDIPPEIFPGVSTLDVLVNENDSVYPEMFASTNMVYYGDWVPGSRPHVLPDGFGFRLPKNGFLLIEIHYGPTPVEQTDLSYLNIFFSKKKVTRTPHPRRFGSGGGIAEPEPPLIIPADSVKSFKLRTIIPFNLSFIAVAPHMHYLGKSMTAYAVLPSGDTVQLARVNNWDFNWQGFYRPKYLIKIPKGTLLCVDAMYDNTSNNPHNPFFPPRTVSQGWKTTDEMMGLAVYFVEYEEGDENIEQK